MDARMAKMQPRLIFISLAALLGSSMAFSFTPIKTKTSASPSALSLSDNTNALPFFAAPAFSGQQGAGAVPAADTASAAAADAGDAGAAAAAGATAAG